MSDKLYMINVVSTIVGIASAIILVRYLGKCIMEKRKRFIEKNRRQGTYTRTYASGVRTSSNDYARSHDDTRTRTVTYEYTVGGKKYYTKRTYQYDEEWPYDIPIYYSGTNPKKHVSGYKNDLGTTYGLIVLAIFLMVVMTKVLRLLLVSIY